jgi:hypothetical protein
MLGMFVDLLFGCRHRNYSFPITARKFLRRPAAATLTGTYVVCLKCGKEFPYDWQQMKVITENPQASAGIRATAQSYAGK